MLTLTPVAGFGCAFLIALGVTPFVLTLARRAGAVDKRAINKIHAREVPRLGGIGIALGFYLPVLALATRANAYSGAIFADHKRVGALLGGGLVILALGIYDDLRGAKAWQKLMVQIPVAAFAWWAGVRIGFTEAPTGQVLVFPTALSLLSTVGWVVLVVNAINLIDGLDGLASGIALEALLTCALCAWHREQAALVLFALCLAGGIAGFLVHNFHPASIFMGDSGSMLIGYVIAVATAWSAQKAATLVGVVLPVVALGLPLLDTSMAVWRRLGTGRRVMSGDLDHIHHRLVRRGWSQRRSVLALYGVGLFFSGAAIAMTYVNDLRLNWPIVALAFMTALAFARWLGYLSPQSLRAQAELENERERARERAS